MRKALLLFLFIAFQQSIQAQHAVLPLWPKGKTPNYQATTETEKWTTGSSPSVTLVQTPEISVYLPTKEAATGQAIIIFPGGGYRFLSFTKEGSDPASWLASKGIAAIVLKYRLPEAKSNITPHLSPLMDAQRAMRTVRANAAKWGIQKNRIGIMGFSAGGHLASSLATHFDEGDPKAKDLVEQQSARPDFAILLYPVISMSKPIMHPGSRSKLLGEQPDATLAAFYSSELQVTKNTPPTFLVHAMDDATVPVENSLLFFQALKDNGVTGELHVFPKGGHGFGLGAGRGQVEKWTDLCLAWLQSLNGNEGEQKPK